jgi:hypothetical protein
MGTMNSLILSTYLQKMAQGTVGFVGLDEITLGLAASLLHSGYAVQAFEVCPISF